MEHTEGPWTLFWHGNETYPYPLSVHTADGAAWIARDGTVSSKASAQLIAAAPELLEALEETVPYLKTHPSSLSEAHETMLSRVQAAIAKAKGGA